MSAMRRPVPLLQLLLAAVLMLMAAWAEAEPTVTEVIPLRYRTADEIIPVLRPLLPQDAVLSGLNNKLIVRTTPSSMLEVKKLLASLDATPRKLMISVRQDANLDAWQRGSEISGRVEGDNASVTVPGSPAPPGAQAKVGGVRARVYGSADQDTDRISQRVQVMEGGRALIRVGQSVPVAAGQVVDTPDGRRVLRSTQFRSANTGFYVVPRLAGEQVTLEIYTAADAFQSPGSAASDIQRVATVVTGRLGEWIELGAIGQQGFENRQSGLARSTDAVRDARAVLVRVDEVR